MHSAGDELSNFLNDYLCVCKETVKSSILFLFLFSYTPYLVFVLSHLRRKTYLALIDVIDKECQLFNEQ